MTLKDAKLDLSGFLGDDLSEEDVEKDKDLFTSLFTNYGDIQLGRSDFVKTLNSLKTDEELLAFIEEHFHIRIPYIPVCEDHQSPGKAFCDVFFNRAPEALWWASRASFKSFGTGLLTVLDTARYRMCETKILAGSQEQGNNVYAAAREHAMAAGLEGKLFNIRRMFTTANNGSSFSILTASPKSVRGPHPQRLKLDEVDEIPREIYDAAVNQPMMKHGVPMGTLMTSTMHKVFGTMSEIVDDAPNTGLKIYKWCYKEVTEQCLEPDCRNLIFSERYRGEVCPLLGQHINRIQDVAEDQQARLKPARTYVKPEDDGELIPGYYDGSCQGDLRRASGYVAVDAQRAARQRVPTKVWEVENECRRPSQQDMVYDPLLLGRGTIEGLTWDTTLPLERSWAMCDWGYNNPTVLLLGQDRQIPGKPKHPTEEFHHCIVEEYYWQQRGLSWRINEICDILQQHDIRQFYADAENVDALMGVREELQKRGYKCFVRGVPFNRFKDIIIERVRHHMEIGHWFISAEGCPQTIKDLYKLHYRKNTEDVAKEEDHGPDAMVAGWRRFLQIHQFTTSGLDVGSAASLRDVSNRQSARLKDRKSMPALPATSAVGIAGKRPKGTQYDRRR